MTLIISPVGINFAFARAVSNEEIQNQETVARNASREAVEQYMRLLVYIIIQKLEDRVEAQGN